MEKGKVSFIVVNWNGKETIIECINSILAQTYENFEIIFIDNHSSDNSVALVKEKYKYNMDKLILLDHNHGYAEANNIGFEQATGEYIALINNDTVLDRSWLEKAIHVFQREGNERVGSVATKIINYHNRDVIDTAGAEHLGFGAGWDYKGLPVNSSEVNKRKEVFGACASAALYRKRILDQIGLFDPVYFIYFEDTDLSFRLRLFGYTCIYEPEAACFHHGGVKEDKDSKFYIDYGRRNIEFLFVKNMQGTLFAKYFLSHFIYELILFFFFLSAGKGIPFLRAKIRFLKNLGYLLQERKKLKLKLREADRLKSVYQVEQYFFRSQWRGLSDKVRKAFRLYGVYWN